MSLHNVSHHNPDEKIINLACRLKSTQCLEVLSALEIRNSCKSCSVAGQCRDEAGGELSCWFDNGSLS